MPMSAAVSHIFGRWRKSYLSMRMCSLVDVGDDVGDFAQALYCIHAVPCFNVSLDCFCISR